MIAERDSSPELERNSIDMAAYSESDLGTEDFDLGRHVATVLTETFERQRLEEERFEQLLRREWLRHSSDDDDDDDDDDSPDPDHLPDDRGATLSSATTAAAQAPSTTAAAALFTSLSDFGTDTDKTMFELVVALDEYARVLSRVDALYDQIPTLLPDDRVSDATRLRVDALLAASEGVLEAGGRAVEHAVGGPDVLGGLVVRAEAEAEVDGGVPPVVRRRVKSEKLHQSWVAGKKKKRRDRKKRTGVTSIGEVVRDRSNEGEIEEMRGRGRGEHRQKVVARYKVRVEEERFDFPQGEGGHL
ncbi:uncharacterized protein BKCO1_3000108 [Diplodia corticola]|uniref:Uncharacterized protein n=1 Tax=Diplodia corticola TaxID=236234 RepID=A0A1J9RG58_9PEZI|nr:uncharacterized protein BKCO1_3000108 [Diplodia corticola]OJD39066.1 hypothetical protein BKCO1_3000108 [Diplodia corticola]